MEFSTNYPVNSINICLCVFTVSLHFQFFVAKFAQESCPSLDVSVGV